MWERRAIVKAAEGERRKLGDRLRELRIERGMSQADAAEAAGIHAVTLARIESGSSNVTITTLVALALAYGVTVRELFGAP